MTTANADRSHEEWIKKFNIYILFHKILERSVILYIWKGISTIFSVVSSRHLQITWSYLTKGKLSSLYND